MSDPKPVFDPIPDSVAAYTADADEFEVTHAPKRLDQATRFAASLPTPSWILDAGCGPGRDLARFTAHGHIAEGVELNPVFAAKANAHAPTVQCDLRVIGEHFPPAAFDGIWAASSLVHLLEADAISVFGQFAQLLRPGGKLYLSLRSIGETGWLDEHDGRRWYTVWDADHLAETVGHAGFTVDQVDRSEYVEVWATRDQDAAGDGS